MSKNRPVFPEFNILSMTDAALLEAQRTGKMVIGYDVGHEVATTVEGFIKPDGTLVITDTWTAPRPIAGDHERTG